MRRSSRIKENIEYYSTLRARKAIDHSHITVLVLDAMEGVVEMDQKNYSGSKNLKFVRFKEKLTCSYIVLLNKKSLGNDRALHFADEMSSLFEVY